ncbi:MAG: putative Na+/H+ antiporter [Chthoniobacterales bacterium]
MKRLKPYLLFLFFLGVFVFQAGASEAVSPQAVTFPRPVDSYNDSNISGLGAKLKERVAVDPFNLVATAIFFLAICHTFLASKFLGISHRFQHRFEELSDTQDPKLMHKRDRLRFIAILFHFLGEIEVVFGIWVIPLAIAIVLFKGWNTMVHYIDGVQYTEPLFVFVIMAIASSKPILRFAEHCLSVIAGIGGRTPAAWWLSILTIGPILGSFITEPAAMTICALLLIERFYILKPSMALRYATLGLLFVNISVGGTLTHFAAPPVVMVASKWVWGFHHMFMSFGWKAVAGILVSNILFFIVFRKELLLLKFSMESEKNEAPIPTGITLVHLLAIGWTVLNAHHPALIIFGLLFIMAFVVATERHQDEIGLRSPMLVGFFLAALIIHGGCQEWWIAPVLGDLGRWPLMIGSTLLTAVNDNAAITYLATLVPGFTEPLKHAVVAGAIAGGGLTVIANAPNPAGQSILQSQFGNDGIHPLGLFLAALGPTLIMGAAFMFL